MTTEVMKDKALQVITTLLNNDFTALFCGGCVRDQLLGRSPKDFDVATNATPEEVKRLFTKVLEVGTSFGVSIVMIEDTPIEVATFRSDGEYTDGRRPNNVLFSSIEEDASRRDFTINSLYMTARGDLIDFFNGAEDIKNKVLRAVGNPLQRIEEDSLRMLRAIRFAAQLGFTLDEKLSQAIAMQAHNIKRVSGERIREEILKICASPNPVLGFTLMSKLGISQHILPEVFDLHACEQDPIWHPEGNVWIHSIGVVDTLTQEKAHPLLVFTGLIHDIGKCSCQQIRYEDGIKRISNIGHDSVGAVMAKDICQRLRFNNEDTDKICNLIANHMKAHYVEAMNKSTLVKFLRELDNQGILEDQILLEFADSQNSGAKRDLREFYAKSVEALKPAITTPCLISGKDLIELGLKPSPLFKVILNEIRELQDSGNLTTKEEAINHVKAGMDRK